VSNVQMTVDGLVVIGCIYIFVAVSDD